MRDRNRLAVQRTLDGKADLAVGKREQRVVAPAGNVLAGVEPGAALAHNDRACAHELTAEHLDAEHLGLRIAAVAGGTATFFLCHVC